MDFIQECAQALGIGKTALAETYGHLRKESGRYRGWVLVSTASETEMANDLRTRPCADSP